QALFAACLVNGDLGELAPTHLDRFPLIGRAHHDLRPKTKPRHDGNGALRRPDRLPVTIMRQIVLPEDRAALISPLLQVANVMLNAFAAVLVVPDECRPAVKILLEPDGRFVAVT